MSFEDVIPSLVTMEENATLAVIPTIEEIKEAMFKMDLDSELGFDGFLGMFFQTCWDIVGQNVL